MLAGPLTSGSGPASALAAGAAAGGAGGSPPSPPALLLLLRLRRFAAHAATSLPPALAGSCRWVCATARQREAARTSAAMALRLNVGKVV